MPTTPEQNERNVREFLDLALNQRRPGEAAERYMGPTYTQHNPAVEDGPEGFKRVLDVFSPGSKLEIKRVVATERYVVTHQHVTRPTHEGPSEAVIDILRVDEDGKIVEHWDVLMPIPDPALAKNANGLF